MLKTLFAKIADSAAKAVSSIFDFASARTAPSIRSVAPIFFLGALFAATLSGCVAPKMITYSTSTYDGVKSARLKEQWVEGYDGWRAGGNLKLGLFRVLSSDDSILLKAVLHRETTLIEGIAIKIDGEETLMRPVGGAGETEHDRIEGTYTPGQIIGGKYIPGRSSPGWSETSHVFSTSIPFIRRMVESDSVLIRVDTSDGYREANFSQGCGGNEHVACKTFIQFLEDVVDNPKNAAAL